MFLLVLQALVSLPFVLAASSFVNTADVAANYSLTASTVLPFPSTTLSVSDSDSFLVANWGLSKGRVQNSAQDLSFVDDPFPASAPPSDGSPAASGPVLKVDYPANGFGPMASGTQLYSLFNNSEPFQSMLLTYQVAFDNNFDWIKGGKLPGLRGGPDPNGCSGGQQPNGSDCFSTRLMWRKDGAGEVYAYIPQSNSICDNPNFICNDDFGISIQRGSFGYTPGSWSRITLVVLLNSPVNSANGYVAVYYNNILALSQGGLRIRGADSISIGGLYFSTFYGGSDSSWAPPSAQTVYFRDIELWGGTRPSTLAASKGVTVRRPLWVLLGAFLLYLFLLFDV